jgi:hypothetical protein
VEWNSRLQKKLMFNFEGWISYNIIMEHVQIRVFKKKNCGHAVMIFADGGTQKNIKQNTDLYYVNERPMLLVVTILVWYV